MKHIVYNVHCMLVRDWQNRMFQARISLIFLSLYFEYKGWKCLLVISCGFYSKESQQLGKSPLDQGFGSASPTISRPCNQLLSVFRWFGYRRAKHQVIPHRRFTAKYTATKIPLMYSFSGNSTASAPISTFMCLWAIYIVPGSVYIFPLAE